jgi:hypothetical protein
LSCYHMLLCLCDCDMDISNTFHLLNKIWKNTFHLLNKKWKNTFHKIIYTVFGCTDYGRRLGEGKRFFQDPSTVWNNSKSGRNDNFRWGRIWKESHMKTDNLAKMTIMSLF